MKKRKTPLKIVMLMLVMLAWGAEYASPRAVFESPLPKKEETISVAQNPVLASLELTPENPYETDEEALADPQYQHLSALWSAGEYGQIADEARGYSRPYSEYAFSFYILSLFKLGLYNEADKVLYDNPKILYERPDFINFVAVSEYQKGNYKNVVELIPFTDSSVATVTVDSMIQLGQFDKIKSMPDNVYLRTKRVLAETPRNITSKMLSALTDAEKLALLQYYIQKNMKNLDVRLIALFNFDSAEGRSYQNYYLGRYYFERGRYPEAVEAFDNVTTEELEENMRFYRGIALLQTEPKIAENDIVYMINSSMDEEKVDIARFHLAQSYFADGDFGTAQQLIDSCDADYCNRLRAKISLDDEQFSDALGYIGEMTDPQAKLIRATAYFHQGLYPFALEEISELDNEELQDEANRLRMLIHFKSGDTKSAVALLKEHSTYPPTLFDGVTELVNIGDDKLAEEFLSNHKEVLPPNIKLLSAAIYARLDNVERAKEIYQELVNSDDYQYEGYAGLLALEADSADMLALLEQISSKDDLPQKDLLLKQFAERATATKNNVMLIQVVNQFFPKYKDSEYAGDIYAARARLFLATGRAGECLADIKSAVDSDERLKKELALVKAECAEKTGDKDATLDVYREIFAEPLNEDTRRIAAEKIINTSPNLEEVLDVAISIRAESPAIYEKTVRRYAETATVTALQEHKALWDELLLADNVTLKCIGLFSKGRMLVDTVDAAANYIAIYDVNPKDTLAKKGLEAAMKIYIALKMPEEANAARSALKSLGK